VTWRLGELADPSTSHEYLGLEDFELMVEHVLSLAGER